MDKTLPSDIFLLLFELKYWTWWIPTLTYLGTYILMLHCFREDRFSASFLVLHPHSIWFYFPKRNRSEKEVRAAALVLQTIWGYKELRKPLEKEGWKKSDFQVEWLLGLRPSPFSPWFQVRLLSLLLLFHCHAESPFGSQLCVYGNHLWCLK